MRRKESDYSNIIAAIVAIAVVAALVFILAGSSFDFSPLSGLISRAAAAVQGGGGAGKTPINPLTELRPMELSAAQTLKSSFDLQTEKNSALITALAQNQTALQLQSIKNNYERREGENRRSLAAKELEITAKYTQLYRQHATDPEKLAKIGLAEIATLTRRNFHSTLTRGNFRGKTNTELKIINRDCRGGILEDNLLFRYADGWASDNYSLAASESGRIANQFTCLSERQSLLLDKALTRAVQQVERRFESNREAHKIFLAGSFQLLLLSLDTNVHLNPESLRFMEDHKNDHNAMFSGKSGGKLAQMGFWLLDRQSGNFEQYNPCGATNCATGIDLVNSLSRRNLGFGDCGLSEMVKSGPVLGKGFICDKAICENAVDAGAIQDIRGVISSILQGNTITAGNVGAQQGIQQRRLPQQQRQNGLNANQRLPGNVQPQGSSQQTQFGTNIPTSQNDICNKRRAQGRTPNRGETQPNTPCGVGKNSLEGRRSNSNPFRCEDANGQTKTFNGVGEDLSCRSSAASSSGGLGGLAGRSREAPRDASQTRENQHNYDNIRQRAAAEIRNPAFRDAATAGGAVAGMDPAEVDQRLQEAEAATSDTLYVHSSEMPTSGGCSVGSGGCTTPNGERYVNIDIATSPAQQTAVTVHEAMHDPSSNGRNDHTWMQATEANSNGAIPSGTLANPNDPNDADDPQPATPPEPVPTTNCGTEQVGEACSCGPMQAKLADLNRCLPGLQREQQNHRTPQNPGGGPISDPSEGIGSSSTSGSFSEISTSATCFGVNRARGAPRTDCSAVTRCPEGQSAIGSSNVAGITSCSCRPLGSPASSGSGRGVPGGEQCRGGRGGLCPGTSVQDSEEEGPAYVDRNGVPIRDVNGDICRSGGHGEGCPA